uniref:Uncharacterized protein n=1 Tax=Rhizophora mucronata TaxID=61149 RepID=A0A2P2NW99_RHIMU
MKDDGQTITNRNRSVTQGIQKLLSKILIRCTGASRYHIVLPQDVEKTKQLERLKN